MRAPFTLRQPPTLEQVSGTILVVGCANSVCVYLRDELGALNCSIHTASDSGQAFIKMVAQDFDIVITDLDPETGAGFDLIKSMALLPVYSARPEIIIWSNVAAAESTMQRLGGVRIGARLRPSDGLEHLSAVVAAVLDDPLQFILKN